MLTSALLNKQPSNEFTTIACISLTKYDLDAGSGEIVFYDLALPYGSLFSNILGDELIDDFSQFRPCGSKAKFDEFKE
ncbi:hypothetical protein MBANPS3_004011 [Mucor bainieri]